MTKITSQSLNAELNSAHWPYINSFQQNGHGVIVDLRVPAGLSYFIGHFPEQAVLPGVVQVHWATELARKVFAISEFRSIKSLKFNRMILPGDEVTLELEFNPQRASVKFAYNSAADKNSSGVIGFAV